jgi:hypothetical protein
MLYKIKFLDNHNFNSVRQWVDDNCKGKSYYSTDWENFKVGTEARNSMYEFELEQDAIVFALRWS